MCLILLAWRCHPQYRLVVAANRDEFYQRPTAPAAPWDEHPHVLAGRDLEQGGTWLGITRHPRFAALTNRRNPHAPPGSRSRGHLVRDYLLGAGTPEHFWQQQAGQLAEYGPFNLLAGTADALFYGNHAGRWQALSPGIYGISNAELDTPWPKVIAGKHALFNRLQHPFNEESLFELLADRLAAPADQLPDTGIGRALEEKLSPRFIQFEGYGTRCSTVMTLSHHGELDFWERAFGPTGAAIGTRHYHWTT